MKSYYLRNSAVVVLVFALLLAGFKIGSSKNYTTSGINEFIVTTSNEPATVQYELLANDERLQVDDYNEECIDIDEPVETSSVECFEDYEDEKPETFHLSLDDVPEAVEICPETEFVQIPEETSVEEESETSTETEFVETNPPETDPPAEEPVVSEPVETDDVEADVDLIESVAEISEPVVTTFEYEVTEYKKPAYTWVRYYTNSQYIEYPVACQVWQILRSWGWNEAVSAGIIGNMMTECGGLTLDLDWDLYDDTWMFYGLCMWSLKWAPETAGLSIEEQMQYLYDTIEVNMDYFGGNLQEFLSITDPGYAALYFQWYYEVGLSSETRYAGALEAYEYFRSK